MSVRNTPKPRGWSDAYEQVVRPFNLIHSLRQEVKRNENQIASLKGGIARFEIKNDSIHQQITTLQENWIRVAPDHELHIFWCNYRPDDFSFLCDYCGAEEYFGDHFEPQYKPVYDGITQTHMDICKKCAYKYCPYLANGLWPMLNRDSHHGGVWEQGTVEDRILNHDATLMAQFPILARFLNSKTPEIMSTIARLRKLQAFS